MARTVGLVIKDSQKKMNKKDVVEKLLALGIEFDGKAKVGELIELLPSDEGKEADEE